jgi:prepilin-type processing-associated H-X9-DG protein
MEQDLLSSCTSCATGWPPSVNRITVLDPEAADNDIFRLTLSPPLRDTPGYQDYTRFGSVHVGGCNMLYCDGRVEVVDYDVDPAVHQRAGDRR